MFSARIEGTKVFIRYPGDTEQSYRKVLLDTSKKAKSLKSFKQKLTLLEPSEGNLEKEKNCIESLCSFIVKLSNKFVQAGAPVKISLQTNHSLKNPWFGIGAHSPGATELEDFNKNPLVADMFPLALQNKNFFDTLTFIDTYPKSGFMSVCNHLTHTPLNADDFADVLSYRPLNPVDYAKFQRTRLQGSPNFRFSAIDLPCSSIARSGVVALPNGQYQIFRNPGIYNSLKDLNDQFSLTEQLYEKEADSIKKAFLEIPSISSFANLEKFLKVFSQDFSETSTKILDRFGLKIEGNAEFNNEQEFLSEDLKKLPYFIDIYKKLFNRRFAK